MDGYDHDHDRDTRDRDRDRDAAHGADRTGDRAADGGAGARDVIDDDGGGDVADPILRVAGLDKTFEVHVLDGTRVVGLDDVSVTVGRGEFLAVVGASGSGKSSLLKCLYRTYEPTGGHAYYRPAGGDPVDLATADDRTVIELRREALGYASQFLDEIPRVPAVDVVSRPLRERGGDVDPEAARARARTLLDRLDVPEALWDAYPATFSGGERQRVNLAQAVAPEPDLLLLDEPTSALDPSTRAAAVDVIRDLLDAGTTVIGVFHDREVVEALADRVLVLADGRVDRVVPVAAFDGEVVA
jgi:alpha-D-ribose 1-methylphosphonate 5-triphosphate synthase subunit PhnL